MQYDVISFSTISIEIQRKTIGIPLDTVGDFEGPFIGGDSSIVVNGCNKLGLKTAIVSVVGDEKIGRYARKRFEADGVDVTRVRQAKGETTAIALLSYLAPETREFVFTSNSSAASLLDCGDVDPELLGQTAWIHVSGYALSVFKEGAGVIRKILDHARKGVRISFDPNYRKENMGREEFRELCMPVMERCDLFLPSEGEAELFGNGKSDEETCGYYARQGKMVARKGGEKGSTLYLGGEAIPFPAFRVGTVDTVGAGDAYDAAMIYAVHNNFPPKKAGYFANAAAGLSTTVKGCMEGLPGIREVEAFLQKDLKDGVF